MGRAAGQRKGSAGLILKNWNHVEGMIARAALPILASLLNQLFDLPPTLLVWSCRLNRNRILQATHPKLSLFGPFTIELNPSRFFIQNCINPSFPEEGRRGGKD